MSTKHKTKKFIGKKSGTAIANDELAYKKIFEVANVPIQQCSVDGKVVRANPKWMEVFGYNSKELKNLPLKKLIHPKKWDFCFKKFNDVVKKGLKIEAESVFLTKEKREVAVRIIAAPLKNKDKIVGTVGMVYDITKENKAAAKISESEKRYRELFDNIKSGVAVYEAADNGEDFIFKDFNKSAEEIEKIKKEKVIGQRLLKIFPGVKKFGFFDAFKKVWQTGQPLHFPATTYKDKRIVGWRDNYIYKLPSGEVVAVYQDLTEQKRIEELLLASEEKFENIFNNSNDVIVYADIKGNIVDVNKKVKDVLGYERRDVLGKNFLKLKIIRAREAAKIFGFFKEAISKGILRNPIDFTLIKKDGREVLIEASTNVIRKDKKIVGVVSLLRDVTERRKMEKSLSESRERFQSLIKYLNDSVYILDRNLKYIYANDRYLLRTSKPLEEIIEKKYGDFHSPKDSADFAKKAEKVFKDGAPFVYGHESERDSGYFLRTISPIKESGKVVSITVISRDITSQQNTEEKLKTHTEELERLNNLMLGRELKMIELKKKINELTSHLENK